MSYVDTSLPVDVRTAFLDEVLGNLPAFLSGASVERPGPVNAAAELLNLRASDLRRVIATHAVLSEPVRALMDELASGLRRPLTSSVRPRVATRAVTSAIDWAATVRYRATSNPLGDVWVTRPANRIFDIAENRALSWLLATIQERATVAGTGDTDASAPWLREIRKTSETVRAKRRTAWLESVPATWPGDAVYPRLNADRGGFYRLRVANAARYLRRLLVDPEPADVVKALCERYFEPSRDWQLFEIAVVLRICRRFEASYVRMGRQSLLVGGRGPFASYRRKTDRREVRIWYQAWPPSTAPSELNDAIAHYGIGSAGTRPDVVCEVLLDGKPARAIVLELKASRSSSYLAAGLSQLLGYLRDRPALTSTEASGWLVPLDGSTFTARPAEGRSLWVVEASAVADRLIDEVA